MAAGIIVPMIADGNFNNFETQEECKALIEKYRQAIIEAHTDALLEFRRDIAPHFSRIVPSWKERQVGDWHDLICKHISEKLMPFTDAEIGDCDHSFCTDLQGKVRLFFNHCPPGRKPAKEKQPQMELQFEDAETPVVSDGSEMIWLRCFLNADYDTSDKKEIRIEYRENEKDAWGFAIWKKGLDLTDEGGPTVLPDGGPDTGDFPFEPIKEDTDADEKKIELL